MNLVVCVCVFSVFSIKSDNPVNQAKLESPGKNETEQEKED